MKSSINKGYMKGGISFDRSLNKTIISIIRRAKCSAETEVLKRVHLNYT